MQLDVEVRGEIVQHDVKILELAALKGVFADVVEDPVTYVNAFVIAVDWVAWCAWTSTRSRPTTGTWSRSAARRLTAGRSRCPAR